jgi:hypothetical protein
MHQKKADVEVVLTSALVIGGKGEVRWSRCQSLIDFHWAPSDIFHFHPFSDARRRCGLYVVQLMLSMSVAR